MATPAAQAEALIDGLPDVIKIAVYELGINLHTVVPNAQKATSCFDFVPPELEKAYQQGDAASIEKFNQKAAKDFDPIYANIRDKEEEAWFKVMNESNNTPYWMSIAGNPNDPSAWMWTYTDPKPVPTSSDSDDSFVRVVQVGTLSKNTKFLGVSMQLWNNKAVSLPIEAISQVVTYIMSSFIVNKLARMPFIQAVTQATLRAGARLIGRGIVTRVAWGLISLVANEIVVGAVAGALLAWLVMFIVDFLWREYRVEFNIFNYTQKAITAVEFWGDNGKVDGDQPFPVAELAGLGDEVTLPDGSKAPVVGSRLVSYGTYIFVNINQFLEGLGVSMRITSQNGKGVLLGYYLGRVLDNQMALSANTSLNLRDFYRAEGSWAPKGSKKHKIQLDDGTWVVCSTPSLSGRSDQYYEFNVTIGLTPSNNFEDFPEHPELPPRQPREYPKIPDLISLGDRIALPGGGQAEVIGKP